jgi:hypothetical protein
MKNKHPKRKLAEKMITPFERGKGTSVFQTKAWEARKEAIRKRIKS